jgi:lipopolysaccharide biosynthesis glycosyltransferase
MADLAITYAITPSYSKHLMATLLTLFASANEGTTYRIYVMVHQPSIEIKQSITEHVRQYGKGSSVVFLEIDTETYQRIPVVSGWLREANFRLLLPKLLPQEERVLYLDADTVVMQDLSHLAGLDLDGKMLAGVNEQDYQMIEGIERIVHFAQLLGLDKDEEFLSRLIRHRYVNSGVLLINLNYWRQHQLAQLAFELLSLPFTRWLLPDQDLINYLSVEQGPDRICYLSPSYNCINLYYPKTMQDKDMQGMKPYEQLAFALRMQPVGQCSEDVLQLHIVHMVAWAPWQAYHYESPFYALYRPFAQVVSLPLLNRRQRAVKLLQFAYRLFKRSLGNPRKQKQVAMVYALSFLLGCLLYAVVSLFTHLWS